jgi:hypothetical protein
MCCRGRYSAVVESLSRTEWGRSPPALDNSIGRAGSSSADGVLLATTGVAVSNAALPFRAQRSEGDVPGSGWFVPSYGTNLEILCLESGLRPHETPES